MSTGLNPAIPGSVHALALRRADPAAVVFGGPGRRAISTLAFHVAATATCISGSPTSLRSCRIQTCCAQLCQSSWCVTIAWLPRPSRCRHRRTWFFPLPRPVPSELHTPCLQNILDLAPCRQLQHSQVTSCQGRRCKQQLSLWHD